MKSILTKMAVVFVLFMALTFTVSGTASAQSVSTLHQTSTTTKAQAVIPAACGWTQSSNWEWVTKYGNVNIIKWVYTCNGGVHCEAIDNSYRGSLYSEGIWLQLNTSQGAYSYAWQFTFNPGNVVNTPTLRGYSGYTCSPSVYNGTV
jgi:hypothetical protein